MRDDGLFDAAQSGGGAAAAGVARGFVAVVEFAHRSAAGGCALAEVVQEFLVLAAFFATSVLSTDSTACADWLL